MKRLAETATERQAEQSRDLDALVKAVKAKDRNAFEVLYDATVTRVFSLAMRITRHPALAEEVVSDVYLQVWQQAANYAPERSNVIAWLCVLCRSRALDALRRDRTANRHTDVGLEAVAEQEDPRAPPDLLVAVEQGSIVHTALRQLTEQQRQLVALAYFKGYKHSELATITGMPIGTIKTQLHRTIRQLKAIVCDDLDSRDGSDG